MPARSTAPPTATTQGRHAPGASRETGSGASADSRSSADTQCRSPPGDSRSSQGALHGSAKPYDHAQSCARAVFGCAEVGEGVGAFVAGIAVMAFHPTPFDAVPPRGVVESAPQVAVLDRLLDRGRPAAFLPVVDPLGDAFADVLAVGEQLDPARSLQGGERLDHGG